VKKKEDLEVNLFHVHEVSKYQKREGVWKKREEGCQGLGALTRNKAKEQDRLALGKDNSLGSVKWQ
jgi:hypothetical protein